jgi:predicted KAP-like P-loop ATPase
VIDDIDRLAADEVRMLFRLVKANADLPRLTYLLLFQRDKVEEALNDPNGSGSEFLKKIVQVGFDIPRLEQADIDSIVFAEIGNLLREIPDDTFDSHRWGNLYYGGLRHFFISLRELYRYLGMLEFYQGLFGPAEHLDVNPIDLIAVQVLRVFEPKLYDSLPHMKSVLTGRDFGSIHGNTDESKKRVLALLDGVSAERKSAVTYVLKQLFPPAEWAFDGYNYADGFATKWAKERRICAPGMFDRYFSLRIGAGEISREEIDAVLAMTGDREKLVVELRRFGASNRLKSLLEHLEYYVDDISLVDAVPFVTAIFDVGDELSEDSIITDGLLSGLMHAVRIVYHFVRRIGTKEDVHERERVVEEAIRETTGTIAPCEAVSFEKRRDESRKDDFLISEDRLLDFQSMCVARIESVAEDNSILGSGHMVTLLRYWNEWAGKERPRKWVDNIVEAGNAPQLLARFVQKGTTTGLGEYVSRIREYVDLRVVEFLIEPDRVEDALRDVRLDDLTADQRKGVELFRKGLALKRSGKGNRRPWDPDDE